MLTWVVGGGGLLGRAVHRAGTTGFTGPPIPWHDAAASIETLTTTWDRFVDEAAGAEWALVWAAGSGVVASQEPELQRELDVLDGFVQAVRATRPAGSGALFLASSAGGLYAGSIDPPFDELTVPCPMSPYGRTKAAQEELVIGSLGDRVPLVLGRISNLYGPGQNLDKPQGLVSQLCLAAATRRPMNLFVPMETLRDYLYVDDAAVMVAGLVAHAVRTQPTTPIVRVLASERPVSVAGVVRVVQQVARRPIRFSLGRAPSASPQARDLRLTTARAVEGDRPWLTPFPVGVKRVYDHTLRRVGAGELAVARAS